MLSAFMAWYLIVFVERPILVHFQTISVLFDCKCVLGYFNK